MRYTAYYLFRPQETLQQTVSPNSEIAEILLSDTLWSSDEGGISAWQEADYIARMKLLFLVYIVKEYSHCEEFPEKLRWSSVSLDTFDTFWTLDRYLLEESREAIEDTLGSGDLELVVTPETPLVVSWLASLRRER
jgi:hypothetical protein